MTGRSALKRGNSVEALKNRLLKVARTYYRTVEEVLRNFNKVSSFELLVSTIISQNTSWRNVEKAIANLKSRGLLSIERILGVDVKELEEALRVAGLYKVKALRIRELAGRLKAWGSSLDELISLNMDEARAKLMELPAVGYKTADVLLAFKASAPVIPVDTHIERIAKRLGIVKRGSRYEEVRQALEGFVPHDERGLFHLALIEFGRKICKSRRPACSVCPLRGLCPSRTS
ncbi:MAG: endonuclease III [Candidatus Nezhaarchaeota archaeon]|nr:endonuclease III [Candidatus Nezhaarchaeota archaeon]